MDLKEASSSLGLVDLTAPLRAHRCRSRRHQPDHGAAGLAETTPASAARVALETISSACGGTMAGLTASARADPAWSFRSFCRIGRRASETQARRWKRANRR